MKCRVSKYVGGKYLLTTTLGRLYFKNINCLVQPFIVQTCPPIIIIYHPQKYKNSPTFFFYHRPSSHTNTILLSVALATPLDRRNIGTYPGARSWSPHSISSCSVSGRRGGSIPPTAPPLLQPGSLRSHLRFPIRRRDLSTAGTSY